MSKPLSYALPEGCYFYLYIHAWLSSARHFKMIQLYSLSLDTLLPLISCYNQFVSCSLYHKPRFLKPLMIAAFQMPQHMLTAASCHFIYIEGACTLHRYFLSWSAFNLMVVSHHYHHLLSSIFVAVICFNWYWSISLRQTMRAIEDARAH